MKRLEGEQKQAYSEREFTQCELSIFIAFKLRAN